MDETRQVKALLTAVAERGVGDVAPPAVGFAPRRRRQRRRTALAALAAVCAVLAVVVPLSVYGGSSGQPVADGSTGPSAGPTSGPTGRGSPAPLPPLVSYPTTGPGTVAALRHDTWSTLPPAPIAVRSGAVGVWTGSRMIVWGGANDTGRYYADGAAYDPAARQWTTLPPAPISARADASYVWTGGMLFVWGGQTGASGFATDGAVYDPGARHWTKLPPAPSPVAGASVAVWTGSRVVLLTSATASSRQGVQAVHAQAYDPARESWSRLPDLHLPSQHGMFTLAAVAVGQRVYVWSMWAHETYRSPSSVSSVAGVDPYLLDTSVGRWRVSPFASPGRKAVFQPLWTGREIVVPATGIWCGPCSHPPDANATGVRFDPRTGVSATLAHGPVSDPGNPFVWTGAGLLGLGGRDVAAWDPASNAWTRLTKAPLGVELPVTVWTGRALLVWGRTYTVAGNGRTASAGTDGLRFGP